MKQNTKVNKNNKDSISSKYLSLVMATMTGLYSLVLVFILNGKSDEIINFIEIPDLKFSIFSIAIPIISLMSIQMMYIVRKRIKRREKNKINEKNEDDNKDETNEES